MSSSTQLEVHDVARGGQHTLVLIGELDLVSAPLLEAKMLQLFGDGTREITLDFSELSFIDSTGLRAVLIANELCKERGYAFSVTPGTGGVQRVLEITGFLEALPSTANASNGGSWA